MTISPIDVMERGNLDYQEIKWLQSEVAKRDELIKDIYGAFRGFLDNGSRRNFEKRLVELGIEV